MSKPFYLLCPEESELRPDEALLCFKYIQPLDDEDANADDEPVDESLSRVATAVHRLNIAISPLLLELRTAFAESRESMPATVALESLLLPVPELPPEGVTANG